MITLAALGTSLIVRRTVAAAAAAAAAPGVRFVSVYSRDAARAAALAAELGLPGSTDDLAGLLASEVDAIYVASPNAIHAAQARQALEAGKHVLVEKPAVGTLAEWDDLCALASERGLVIAENMRIAHDPTLARIAGLMPSLGPIRRVTFSLSQRSSRYDDVLAGRHVNIFDPALGGGALADLGVYVVNALIALFGSPERVAAALVELPTGADGAGAALLTYPGMVAELAWSKITSGRLGGQIEGELGTLTIDRISVPSRLVVDLFGEPVQEYIVEKPHGHLPYEIERFVTLINGGDPEPDHRRTLMTLRTMEAIRASRDGLSS